MLTLRFQNLLIELINNDRNIKIDYEKRGNEYKDKQYYCVEKIIFSSHNLILTSNINK